MLLVGIFVGKDVDGTADGAGLASVQFVTNSEPTSENVSTGHDTHVRLFAPL